MLCADRNHSLWTAFVTDIPACLNRHGFCDFAKYIHERTVPQYPLSFIRDDSQYRVEQLSRYVVPPCPPRCQWTAVKKESRVKQQTKRLTTLFAGASCLAVPAVHAATMTRTTEQMLHTSTPQQKQQVKPATDKKVSSSTRTSGTTAGSESSVAASTN